MGRAGVTDPDHFIEPEQEADDRSQQRGFKQKGSKGSKGGDAGWSTLFAFASLWFKPLRVVLFQEGHRPGPVPFIVPPGSIEKCDRPDMTVLP
jgi:hypothetical protein